MLSISATADIATVYTTPDRNLVGWSWSDKITQTSLARTPLRKAAADSSALAGVRLWEKLASIRSNGTGVEATRIICSWGTIFHTQQHTGSRTPSHSET